MIIIGGMSNNRVCIPLISDTQSSEDMLNRFCGIKGCPSKDKLSCICLVHYKRSTLSRILLHRGLVSPSVLILWHRICKEVPCHGIANSVELSKICPVDQIIAFLNSVSYSKNRLKTELFICSIIRIMIRPYSTRTILNGGIEWITKSSLI